jgi:predicted dienelactone hydrolase
MPRYWIWIAAILFNAMVSAANAAPEDRVGVRSTTLSVPTRGQAVELTVWYPTAGGGSPEKIGNSKIFQGIPTLRNAPAADGHYPVILIAHGGFRAAAFHEGWIAAYLAGRGYIVGVTRPPALGPRDAQLAVQEIWLRPADLSAALSVIENDPLLSARIKPNSVGAIGFFLGGTSVLGLAGARLDPQSYKHLCDKPEAGADCAWFAKAGVDLGRTDASRLARSHLDPRIKVVVAVDPELSKSFDPASLTAIKIPVTIINLGHSGMRHPAFDAESLGRTIPHASYDTVADAVAFSAFSLCTPRGPALLQEEGDEMICRDGGGRSREEIHRELAGKIESAFKRGLSAEP